MKLLKSDIFNMIIKRSISKIIKKSKYPIASVPEVSLPQFIFKDISKCQNKPAITCGISKRTLTFNELKVLTNKLHYELKETVGLEPNDVIGLILPNKPEFPAIVYGALQHGLRVTFINPIFTSEEISNQFINAEVKCIVAMNDNKDLVNKVILKLKGYKGTIYLYDNGNLEFEGQPLLNKTYTNQLEVSVNPHDIAVLPYSSGTTGVPKGVMLTHNSCIANIIQITQSDLMPRNPTTDEYQDRVLNVIPFYHIYGFNGIMNYSIEGSYHLITIPKFVPEDYIHCLEYYKPTILFTVPSLLLYLASSPAVKTEHLESVKKVTTGAAPATKQLIEKFKAKLKRNDVIITQGYGLSETSPVVLLTPNDMPNSKTGSTGVLVPATTARIVCLETGKDLQSNQEGELLIKGPQVMKGYLKNDKVTAETIDGEGWLHTGDVAFYDDDDYYYIVDRCKELIKCKGNQVSPTELEGIIMELDEVADVAVVGIAHDKYDEVPMAFIVLKADKKITEEKINNFINPRIAPYKQLIGGIKFIDNIPRNHAGKIIRKQLKTMV